jgi:ATP adenylyltransferase
MDKLWAPWRMKYIQGIDSQDAGECIFCEKPRQQQDKENLILMRAEKNFVILNLYPYNNGHLMIVPYEHAADCSDLDADTAREMWQLVIVSKRILERAFHPEGFNIGMNIGRVAGAGIDRHIHMHIVPRWNGDTNYMPVVGDTKVISQALDETYDTLLPYFREAEISKR